MGIGVRVRVRYATNVRVRRSVRVGVRDRYVSLQFRVSVMVRAIFGSQSRSGG